ncbi:hypothetical protein NC653_013003 [Populus alba x Populus x berolinensis]|uniref:Reverse transcriptase n=3 Tax=Populus TaxID=3689 RepID=A0A4U5QKQ3_POPAL|nr:hypothetical protein NC653_013003 [Populus alba x Populus x berolinensis]TKS10799.1 hypothetical protein D5086_0000078640 [Populus alba]
MASAIGNPIRVDMNWYNIECEGLRIICGIYGCYGRLGRACPMENVSEAVVPEAEMHVSESQAAEASGTVSSQSIVTDTMKSAGPSKVHGEWTNLPHLRPGIKLKKRRARREDSDGTWASKFLHLMATCNLVDLGYQGPGFTWHCHIHGGRYLAKSLDRALSNLEWHITFPEAFVENLCLLYSDHNPIILRFSRKQARAGGGPFKFEEAWTPHPSYQELVSNAWGRSDHNVLQGLQEVRQDSIDFNKNIFGNIFQRKRRLEARLNGIQR